MAQNTLIFRVVYKQTNKKPLKGHAISPTRWVKGDGVYKFWPELTVFVVVFLPFKIKFEEFLPQSVPF